MTKYKCVIFDCDGVLVDSEPIGNRVLVEMANELGANIDLDYAYRNFKGHKMQACADKVAELIPIDLPQNFIQEYRQRSFEAFRTEIQPVAGVEDLIENLNIPYCVASSGPENKIKLNLELTGLLPYFTDTIFSCYAIQKWKPNPEIFLWAAESMGFKTSECIIVEDSITGIKAARNGNFDVIGYTAHDYNNELPELSTFTFGSMSEIKQFLNTSLD